MKKILLGILMLFASVALFACRDKEPEQPIEQKEQLENPVSLAGLYASTTSSTTKVKTSYKLDTTTPNYQFVVLMNDTTNFELTIKLDNPKDYHIFDFTLICEDENAKVLVDNEYELLSNLKSLNWRGTTNTKYVLKMQVSSVEFVNTISLTSMYYSDRADGTIKYDVDLDNKGTIDVYRLYDGIEVEMVDFCNQKINVKSEYVDTTSIMINGVSADISQNVYLKNGLNTISYYFVLNDNAKYLTSIAYTKKQLSGGYMRYSGGYTVISYQIDALYLPATYNVKVIDRATKDVLGEQECSIRINEFIVPKTDFENIYFLINNTYIDDWFD